jgi:hypothetical protein
LFKLFFDIYTLAIYTLSVGEDTDADMLDSLNLFIILEISILATKHQFDDGQIKKPAPKRTAVKLFVPPHSFDGGKVFAETVAATVTLEGVGVLSAGINVLISGVASKHPIPPILSDDPV